MGKKKWYRGLPRFCRMFRQAKTGGNRGSPFYPALGSSFKQLLRIKYGQAVRWFLQQKNIQLKIGKNKFYF